MRVQAPAHSAPLSATSKLIDLCEGCLSAERQSIIAPMPHDIKTPLGAKKREGEHRWECEDAEMEELWLGGSVEKVEGDEWGWVGASGWERWGDGGGARQACWGSARQLLIQFNFNYLFINQ